MSKEETINQTIGHILTALWDLLRRVQALEAAKPLTPADVRERATAILERNEAARCHCAIEDARDIPDVGATCYSCGKIFGVSAADNPKNEEEHRGTMTATPPPDQFSGAEKSSKGEASAPCGADGMSISPGPAPEPGSTLHPRVNLIRRDPDGWRAIETDCGAMIVHAEAADIQTLVGVNDNAYAMIGDQAIQIAALKADHDDAIREVLRLRGELATAERMRNAAQAECNRLLDDNRRLTASNNAASRWLLTADPQAMVRQFSEKFGVPCPAKPGFPSRERMDLRMRLEVEEFIEFVRDCGYGITVRVWGQDTEWPLASIACAMPDKNQPYPRNFPKAIDAIADRLYVAYGTALEMGTDMHPIFAEVHRSNMAKEGTDANGKVAKPKGWQPPDIEGELRKQGWEG